MHPRLPKRKPARLVLLLERGKIAGHVALQYRTLTLCGEPFASDVLSPDDGRVTCAGCRVAMMRHDRPGLPAEIVCDPLPPLAACCADRPCGAVMVPGGDYGAACAGCLMAWPPYLRQILPGAMQ